MKVRHSHAVQWRNASVQQRFRSKITSDDSGVSEDHASRSFIDNTGTIDLVDLKTQHSCLRLTETLLVEELDSAFLGQDSSLMP